MRKILLIAPTFGIAKGSHVQAMMSAYKTAWELSRHAHVIVLAAGPTPRYERCSPTLEVHRLWNIYLRDPVNYMIPPGIFWRTIQLLRRERPDVILVNKFMFFNAFVIPLLKLLGRRVVTQVDAFPSIDWHSRTPWIRPIMWCYLRVVGIPLLRMSDYVILFHEGMVPIAERYGLRYRVIHNGVDVETFDRAEVAPELRKEHSQTVHVAYVGRLESMKGYDVLLDAWESIAPQHPYVRLFMVGATRGKEAVVQRYTSPQVRFLDVRDDVPAILKGVDIFVLPSFSEGLSNALMEAMAAGCACIATDTSGGNRVLIEEGVTGRLVRVGDRDHLAATIRELLDDAAQRQRLGANAQARIRERFNWATIAKQYLELFEGGRA